MYYLSEAWFLSCEDIPLAECAFKISTRPPHYTLAVFGAYLCFFFSCWAKHPPVTLPWLTVDPVSVPPAALGIVLTSGCATSRHCQQQELPGVRIHCCDSDLCNSASSWHPGTLHYVSALLSLLLLRMWLWCGVSLERMDGDTSGLYGRNDFFFCISHSHFLS